ncbi:MAG: endolytic transglycosylase MltG [Coriobacteriales bacterium]|nr:endolytic transglycosylase MltG [Coriobacteriales bacterium]
MAQHIAKKKSSGKLFPIIIISVILIVIAGAAIFFFMPKNNVEVGKEVTIEVVEGDSAKSIGAKLADEHLINSSNDFVSYVKQKNLGSQLKPGTYHFVGGMSVQEIADAIVAGAAGVKLTIPEGYKLTEIAKEVAQTTHITYDDFYAKATNASAFKDDYPYLVNTANNSLEGFLFPDTYFVDDGFSANDLIALMLKNFDEKISTIDMTYAKSKNLDVYKLTNLASIIEKESGSDDDKKNISSVLYNRLDANMALQCDPTTYYAVGKEMTEELTDQDLKSDSPYNTRNPNNKGLPPGPIASPGYDSLVAAAQPADTKYYYFFYSYKDSKTYFFETLDQFNAALAKDK